MRDQGLNAPLMGGDGIVSSEFTAIAGPGAEGTLMTFGPDARKNPNAKEVVERFRKKGYEPEAGELRFDMYEGEFTHEGDRCTFEVLLARAGLDDPALAAIGEIVHDIDLKDAKFGRDEASGIARVMDGIAAANREDERRLERGAAVLDDLYEVFRKKRR